MKYVYIFSPRVCGELLDKGFQYIEKRRDKKDPRFWVYVFEETSEFAAAMSQIMTH